MSTVRRPGKTADYRLFALALGSGLALITAGTLRRVEVTGDSMLPALAAGDRLLVARWLPVRPGHLAVLADPRHPNRPLVKRMASLSPEGVLVVGDNPVSSTDGRHFGPVPRRAIQGRAYYRYEPSHRRGFLRGQPVALPSTKVSLRGSVTMWTDDVERVTAGDLGDLTALSIDDLRAHRDECRKVEDKVSYLRRLAQGRLDIVTAELRRRSEGTASADLPTLVEELPGILSDRSTPSGPGRLPSSLTAPDDEGLTDELDMAAPAGALGDLGDQPLDTVETLARNLAEFERKVSAGRRALFDRIDALQAELTRRYKSGEVNVSSVLE